MSIDIARQNAVVCGRKGGGLQLRLAAGAGCQSCAQSKGCNLLALRSGGNEIHLNRSINADIRSGQLLQLEMPARGLAGLALLHYLVPPAAMFLSAWLAVALTGGGDSAAVIGAAIGLLVGCLALKLYDARAGQYWLDRLQITKVMQPESDRPDS